MRSIAIHQPNYIPWLGYFYKIYLSDVFVFLDDVQFSNTGLHNYHFIKTSTGPVRLRIPVVQTLGDKIYEVMVKNDFDWRKNHLEILSQYYHKAAYYDEVYNDFKMLISQPFTNLRDLNISIVIFLCDKLGIRSEFKKSSDLAPIEGREARIIDICKNLNGDVYISGIGAKAYQDEYRFDLEGIKLKYSEYKVFEYNQQFEGFQSNVTILDYLMNCGYDWDRVMGHQK